MDFESLGRYHWAWAGIVLCAPDGFLDLDGNPVVDQKSALEEAFEEIRSGFHFVEKKIKDQRLLGVLRELITMSHESYKAGETMRAAHIFQECEGLIWPSRAGALKYVVEAEQRAFGSVELFKNVVVSPFPYEGTVADLGPFQRVLFEHAQLQSQPYVDDDKPFKSLTWALGPGGEITSVKERSWKATVAKLQQAAVSGEIVACATAAFPHGGESGILRVDIEQIGHPRVEAIALVKLWKVGTFSYHLYEPEIFKAGHADA